MTSEAANAAKPFEWTPLPEVGALVYQLTAKFTQRCKAADLLAERMHTETGTRLVDWIDHFALPDDDPTVARLPEFGFVDREDGAMTIWEHPGGLFPAIYSQNTDNRTSRIAIKVESVDEFLFKQQIDDRTPIEGDTFSAMRQAQVAEENDCELWAVERHGYRDSRPQPMAPATIAAVLRHRDAFRRRQRLFSEEQEGFEHAARLIQAAQDELGIDRTCDLWFAAERDYWQSRNRAARVQRARQDALGLGWANHDHHTYRSSRQHYASLIRALEQLGFGCRERFYAGSEAGWGAQVLEHPGTGIVVFADVDMEPEEVSGDFAHEGLAPQDHLATVGLWCKLHGESFLEAGLHHLECQFNFDATCKQLRSEGIESMPPFTNFDFLRQAFTVGEMWPVREERIAAALDERLITPEQAEQFRQSGALGSHLEILQRDDGYKGFNQTGVSDIIARTDPRLH